MQKNLINTVSKSNKKDEANFPYQKPGQIKTSSFLIVKYHSNSDRLFPALNQARKIASAPATTPKTMKAAITPAKILMLIFLSFIIISSQFIFYYLRNILKSDW